ncbi:MAG: RNA polymerase sigma-70 factor [Melioribacteraceae bacterium]
MLKNSEDINIDFELLQKIKLGDQSIFQILFEKYYSPLTRFAYIYIKEKDISEEIVQDFFVQFWIKRETISISTSVKSYLYSSIRNKSLNYLRDRKDDLSMSSNLHVINTIGGTEDNYEIDYIELKTQIISAVESLPEKCKNIFKLSRNKKLTYKQIAEKLQVSEKTVESQMRIALQKLREKLQPILKSIIILFVITHIL